MKFLLSAAFLIFSIQAGFPQRNIATLSGITITKAIDNKVFFTATHDLYGTELFVSDGSTGNYELVKDINPGYPGSTPGEFTLFNDQLFFTAYSPEHGLCVWKSDGTAAGTTLVYAVRDADPHNLMVFKGKLYFTTHLGSIVRTDGTPGGTEVFYQSDFTWGRIATVIKTDQYIYFTSDGRTIYRDDGFTRIDFMGPLSWEDVSFKNLFVIGNTLVAIKASTYDDVIRIYSINNDALGGEEDEEWLLIKKLDAPIYGSQEIENFTNAAGKLFFSFRTYFDNVPPADELWICDGTEAGTKMLKSFSWDPHYYQSEMSMFFSFNGNLFFRGGNAVNRALWTSDGTTAGTMKFHDVVLTAPQYDERIPVLLTENTIYFAGSDGSTLGLWRSDGTPERTQKVIDVEDGDGGVPHNFSFSNDVLYFVTTQQFSSTLWSTVPAADISVTRAGGGAIQSGSKPNLFFGVALGACHSTEIVIKNKGLEELYLSEVLLTGKDFHLVQKSLPEMLSPGASVTIQIVFNPVSESTSRATLMILSNDSDESKYIIYLEGRPSPSSANRICQFPQSGYVKRLRPAEVTKSIILSNSTIAEGQPLGTIVGTFNLPANATFVLASGEGDVDNQHFFIEGNVLKSNTVFNFDARPLYSLRVKAVSSEGETEASFRIGIANASVGFDGGECGLKFEQMSFSYTALEANQMGHLFAATSQGKILRSIDGGGHWEVVFSDNYSRLSEIIFYGNTGFAHGYNTLLKSEDAGASWFKLYLPLTGDYYASGICLFFFSEMEGYIGTDEGEVFFTGDGGRTWETRVTGLWDEFRDLFFVSKNKGYAIADFGDLLQTIDGGRSWTTVDLSPLGWNTRVRDILFVNENDGFMIGDYKFYTTSNGGQAWIEVPTFAGGEVSKLKFFDENQGFLYGGNGALYKTINGGDHWELTYPGILPGRITGIAQASGKLFITGGDPYYNDEAARSLAVSSDGGVIWSTLHYLPSANIYYADFSHEKGIVIGEDGMFKTADNGLTWKQAVIDLAGVADVHFIDEHTVVMVSGGHLYKSTDGGVTTRRVLTTEQDEVYHPAGKLYGFPGDIIFSVSWYAVYRSDDEGETWDMVSTNPGYYTQAMHFISPSTGYRVELFGSIEKTTDGGRTWTEIFTRAPEVSDPFNALFFLNETIGYKGGEVLQRTTDGGISWETVHWPFYDITGIYFDNEHHGYVVTRGGGVFETKDKGATWETIYTAPARISSVQFGSGEIFLAGETGFVARMNATPTAPSVPGYIYGPNQLCVGDAAQFHVAVSGDDIHTQWSTTAGTIEDHSGSVTVSFPEAGEYTITAKHFNACGASESRTATVSVAGPPSVPVIEGADLVLVGDVGVEYTVVNGNESSKFLWEAEGSANTSPAENRVIVDWGQTPGEGSIKVLEVDAAGCRAYGALAITLEVPLAIETDLQSQVSIYPNPTETDTNISSSHSGLLLVRILDILGREYSRITLSRTGEHVLKTERLPSGLYLIEISDGVHAVTKKLIRQ